MDPAHPLPARDSHAQQPPRSILKSSGARRDAPAPSGSSSSAPQVQFKGLPPLSAPRVSSKSSSHSQKPIQNVGQIPNAGPIPPVMLPATANRDELEVMAFHLAAHLRELRIAEEEARRKQDAQRLPRPTRRPDHFPEFKKILMGPWAGGFDYGPVFDSSFIAHVHYSVRVNPVLLAPAQHVVWDMKYSLDTATISSSNGAISLESICPQPATSPRLTEICIVSDSFSWALRVSAMKRSAGITVGDVFDFLADFFSTPLGSGDLEVATPSHRTAMEAVFKERTSRSFGPSKLCVHDWMLGRASFGGFVHDPTYTSPDILGRAGEVYLRLTLNECQ